MEVHQRLGLTHNQKDGIKIKLYEGFDVMNNLSYYERNKERILQQQKEYRKNNKETVSKFKKNYYNRNRELLIEKSMEWQNNNSEYREKKRKYDRERTSNPEFKEKRKQYYKDNEQRIKLYQAEYRKKQKQKKKHREYMKNYNKIYYKNNKEKLNNKQKEYRNRPETKEKRKQYMKEYMARPEVKERRRLYRISKGISTNNYTDYPSLSMCVQLSNYIGSANNPYTLNELCVRGLDYTDIIDLISSM